MKKVVFLTVALLMVIGLTALQPSNYEDYIVIKYLINIEAFEKAGELIDNYLETSPDDPFVLSEKAFILKNWKNDRTSALKILIRVSEIYPEYYYANFLHASILFAEYFGNQDKKDLILEGIKYAQIALKDNPNHYDSFYLLGALLNEVGRHEESNTYFEKLNQIEENPGAYFYMAQNYKNLGEEDAELKTYHKILEFNPNDPRVLQVLSQIYFKKKDFSKASQYLEKLFSLAPEDKETGIRYLYSLFFSGNAKAFLQVSDQVDISDSPTIIYFKAMTLSREGKFTQAEKLLNQLDKMDYRAQLLMADISVRQNNFFEAYEALKKIGKENKNSMYYSLLLDVMRRLNLNKKVLSLFEIIQKESALIQTFTMGDCYNVIFAHIALGEFKKLKDTVSLFNETIKEKSVGLGELVRLLADFSEGKTINPDHIKHTSNLFLIVQLYKSTKQYDRAMNLLKMRIKKPAEEVDLMEIGDLYFQQEKYGMAEDLIRKLWKKNPESIEVSNFYAYILAIQGTKLDLALRLSAHTIAKEPNNTAYLDTYGYILLKMGKVSEAKEYLLKAYRRDPLEKDILDHLADCYRLENKHEEIINIYNRALEEDVDYKEELLKKLEEEKKKVYENNNKNSN